MIDTSARLEVRQSPWQMLKLFALAVVMTAVSAIIALPGVSGFPVGRGPESWMAVTIGWIGTLFFGFCLIVIAWRAATTRGPVIVLSPEGFEDRRVADGHVPWRFIHRITTWEAFGERIVVLGLTPGAADQIPLTAMARLAAGADASLGADGLSITTRGLSIDHDQLIAATLAYARAHGAPLAD